MKVNLLRDVRPSAISLVSKGANRKRWAMLKSGEVIRPGQAFVMGDVLPVVESEEPDADAVTLPGPHRIVKADGEWEAAYCVVAEPGWQEDPGVGAPDQSIPDEWADEDEIRKAAHHFMLSGGLINAMHQSLDPWGTVVENYVAPADFTVGSETIRKGSWVIAIKPTELGREAIDKGDFTGISLEGHGLRELIEKGAYAEAKHPRDPLTGEWIDIGGGAPTAASYLEESVNYGGVMTPRGEVIADLQSRGQGQAAVDRYMQGLDRAQKAEPAPVGFGAHSLTGTSLDTVIASYEQGIADIEAGRSNYANGGSLRQNRAWLKRAKAAKAERAKLSKADTVGYLCSNCGTWIDEQSARDRATCPECRNRFRNAPRGVLAKSGDLPDAIRKDALLVPNKPGVTNWIERAGGLPKFIADIAGDLISEKGHTTGRAISIAVGVVRNWCHGHGGHVNATTRGKACVAAAEWEAKKAKAHLTKEHAQPDDLHEIADLAADRQLVAKAEARASAGDSGSLGSMAHTARDFLRKMGKRVGMTDEEIASLDEIEKGAALTFAEVYAQRDFEDELPEAFDALRSAVFNAFYPGPDETRSPADLIGQSLDEFKSWALDLVSQDTGIAKAAVQVADEVEMVMDAEEMAALEESAPLVKAQRTFSAEARRAHAKKGIALPDGSYPIPDKDALKRAMRAVGRAGKSKAGQVKAHIRRRAKALGAESMLSEAFAKSDASEAESGNVDSEMGLTPEELERVEGLEGRLDGIEKRLIGTEEEPGLVAKIATSVEKLTKAAEEGDEDEKQPTPDELQTSFNEFKGEVTERFEKLGESIEKLGDGGTSQEGGEGSEDTEGRKAESIVKAYEDRNLDPKLVGIL